MRRLLLLALGLGSAACGDGAAPGTPGTPPARTDTHEGGVTLSGGVTTSRIGEACAPCHADVVEHYRSSGMFHALTLPTGGPGSVEARMAGRDVTDPESGITGHFGLGDGKYVQRLFYRDPDGVERAAHEMEVDLVIGSGHSGRGYFQVEDGEFLMLPLAWYQQIDDLGLSPGPQMRGRTTRLATHLCVSCHTGQVTPRDTRGSHGFRGELSLGVGCVRCHGDAADHIETGDPRTVVNPARLSEERQSDVCHQCHFASGTEFVNPEHSPSEYVPGEPLGLVMAAFVPEDAVASEDAGASGTDHATRLQRSVCYQRSESLTCTMCHNPHRGFRDASAASDTQGGCLVCHQEESCGEAHGKRDGRTCVSCHMPRTSANDIPHNTVTDHFIRRRPPAAAPSSLTPEERSLGAHALADRPLVNRLDPEDRFPGSLLAKVDAYVTGYDFAEDFFGERPAGYLDRALRLLDRHLEEEPEHVEALLWKAAVLRRARTSGPLAVTLLERAMEQAPDHPEVVAERGRLAYATGDLDGAADWLGRAWSADPYDGELGLDYGVILARLGRPGAALDVLGDVRERVGPSVKLARIGMRTAWEGGLHERGLPFAYDLLIFKRRDPGSVFLTAQMAGKAGAPADGVRALYRETLRLDPGAVPPMLALAGLEESEGNRDEALRLARKAAERDPASEEAKRLLERLR